MPRVERRGAVHVMYHWATNLFVYDNSLTKKASSSTSTLIEIGSRRPGPEIT